LPTSQKLGATEVEAIKQELAFLLHPSHPSISRNPEDFLCCLDRVHYGHTTTKCGLLIGDQQDRDLLALLLAGSLFSLIAFV
jgi:hypothetical protein